MPAGRVFHSGFVVSPGRAVLACPRGLSSGQLTAKGRVLGEETNEQVSAPAADSRLVEIVCFERRWKRSVALFESVSPHRKLSVASRIRPAARNDVGAVRAALADGMDELPASGECLAEVRDESRSVSRGEFVADAVDRGDDATGFALDDGITVK